MAQPVVEQAWEVWLVLRLAALGGSVFGSSWLLRATCKQPTIYLFNCQLRHLAFADLCLSLVDPGYELAVWAIWPVGAGLPPLFNICWLCVEIPRFDRRSQAPLRARMMWSASPQRRAGDALSSGSLRRRRSSRSNCLQRSSPEWFGRGGASFVQRACSVGDLAVGGPERRRRGMASSTVSQEATKNLGRVIGAPATTGSEPVRPMLFIDVSVHMLAGMMAQTADRSLAAKLVRRGLFHALLCVVCFVEAQIAAGVLGSALHSQRCFSLLAKLLVFAWPAAAAVGAVDAVAMHLHTEGQRAFGFTKVLEVVLFTNFLLTLLMYLTSLVAVMRTPSPSAVVRRASLRALAYPCGFLITAFPDWLLYIRVIPENLWSGRLASLAMYSNGWVNAAVYGCQNRHLCPGSRRTTPGLTLQGRRGSSPSSPLPLLPSFHVGFRVGDSRSLLQTASSEDPVPEEETGSVASKASHAMPACPRAA
eukprot:s5746_g6.t2